MTIREIINYLVLVAPIFIAIGHILSAYSSWNASIAQKEAAAALVSLSRSHEAISRSQEPFSRSLEAISCSLEDIALSIKQAFFSFVHGQFLYRFYIPDPIPEPTSSRHEN